MPLSTRDDTKGAVYVLDRYVNNRMVVKEPSVNADRHDTDFFYAEGIYGAFPDLKHGYEERRRKERVKRHLIEDWSRTALDRLDKGQSLPQTTRRVLPEVLSALYQAGFNGITRPEMCRLLNKDGGKVSGVMTDLHGAGIIFPLEGVRR